MTLDDTFPQVPNRCNFIYHSPLPKEQIRTGVRKSDNLQLIGGSKFIFLQNGELFLLQFRITELDGIKIFRGADLCTHA
jgi:hypothetical protein